MEQRRRVGRGSQPSIGRLPLPSAVPSPVGSEPPRVSGFHRAKDAIEAQLPEDIQELHQAMFERSTDCIFTCDLNGSFLYANKATLKFLGLPLEELRKKRIADVVPRDQLAIAIGSLNDLLQTGSSGGMHYLEMQGNDGQMVKLSVNSSLIMRGGVPHAVLAIVRDVTGVSVMHMDLQKANELNAIGQASSRAAHDIKNLITPARSLVGYLAGLDVESLTRDQAEMIRSLLSPCSDALDAINKLTKEMMVLSSPGIMNGGEVDVNLVVRNVLLQAQARLGRTRPDLGYNMNFARDIPRVYGDTLQLERAFLNIVINGIEAMPGPGELGISTQLIDVREGRFVKVIISDTGHGMSREVLDKAFTPYFSTKGERGTGLGLAISLKMINDHLGEIHVCSEEGKGTTFEIILPVR